MEQKQDHTNLIPINHANSTLPGDSKLKSELTLLHRKYNRLEQKEKRIQVNSKTFYKTQFNPFLFSAIMSRMGNQS